MGRRQRRQTTGPHGIRASWVDCGRKANWATVYRNPLSALDLVAIGIGFVVLESPNLLVNPLGRIRCCSGNKLYGTVSEILLKDTPTLGECRLFPGSRKNWQKTWIRTHDEQASTADFSVNRRIISNYKSEREWAGVARTCGLRCPRAHAAYQNDVRAPSSGITLGSFMRPFWPERP